MGIYDSFRHGGAQTRYPANKTPVSQDVVIIGLIYASIVLLVSFLVIIPSYKGKKALFYLLRVVLSVFVLASIVVCVFGQGWEVAELSTRTAYRAGVPDVIEADITVNIGLSSLNITLKGKPEVITLSTKQVEKINYNERFSWDYSVGNRGFGPRDSLLNVELRNAKEIGKPTAILRILEYFTYDGGDYRWNRFYQSSAYYVQGLVWAAFPMWIITIIVFQMVPVVGAYSSLITGGLLVTANLTFACYRNPLPLRIHFDEQILEFRHGWTFILCAFNGAVCILLGFVVIIMDETRPEALLVLFDLDPGRDCAAAEDEVPRFILTSSTAEEEISTDDLFIEHINVVHDIDDNNTDHEAMHPRPRIARLRKRSRMIGSIKVSLQNLQTGGSVKQPNNNYKSTRRRIRISESEPAEKAQIRAATNRPHLYKGNRDTHRLSAPVSYGGADLNTTSGGSGKIKARKTLSESVAPNTAKLGFKESLDRKVSSPMTLSIVAEDAIDAPCAGSSGETSLNCIEVVEIQDPHTTHIPMDSADNVIIDSEKDQFMIGIDNRCFTESTEGIDTGNIYDNSTEL